MSRKNPWFEIYENDRKATHFSMAGGGARLLALLLTVAAVPVTILLLFAAFRMFSTLGMGRAWFFLLEELDEMLLMVFMMWSAVILLRYAAHVFWAKADMAVGKEDEMPQETAVAES